MTPMLGTVRATANLNIRQSAPSTSAKIYSKASAGTELPVRGLVDGESVSGNRQWYAGNDDTFFWSGACGGFQPQGSANVTTAAGSPPPALGAGVHRRANGTMNVLGDQEIRSVYGDITYQSQPDASVKLDPQWVSQNIVAVPIPVLAALGRATIDLHTKARGPFERAFAAIAAAGLNDRIKTYGGSFVPRHKGWDRSRNLSAHSWGIAIDLNVAWNGYGNPPAAIGRIGSVRELVPYFESEGIAWGGYFSSPYEDGMHFELARYDL